MSAHAKAQVLETVESIQALDTHLFLPSDIAVVKVEIWAKNLESMTS